MATQTISNSDDVIDSRDVIARIDELEEERAALAEELQEAASAKDGADNQAPDADYDLAQTFDAKEEALADWDVDNADELKALKSLAEEAEGYASDWTYGALLIRRSHFVDYCEELCKDIGDLPRDIPSYLEIDWQKTADNLEADYTTVDFDGVEYLIR